MKKIILGLLIFAGCLFTTASALAENVEISSLEKLAEYAGKSGNTVRMEPGIYQMTDYIPLSSIEKRREEKKWQYIRFTGSDNKFDLRDVTIEFDTQLREKLNPPRHSQEFVLSGNNNTLKGLTIQNIGDGTSKQGNVFSVMGNDNTVQDVTLMVRGSHPYGYGDLLGKGRRYLVVPHEKLRKHSGMRITGNNNRILGCEVYMRAFGHAFYIQKNPRNVLLKDCYAEGQMRSTDEMLAESSGIAYEKDFRSAFKNKEGDKEITSGYMKSLNECGFRTYGKYKNVKIIDCHAKNLRVGFALNMGGDCMPEIRGSVAEGCERGFNVSNVTIEDCRGDAKYGPLLYMNGGANSEIDLALMPDESDKKVHAIATICGDKHDIRISAAEGKRRDKEVPLMLGYKMPRHGENMSPIPEAKARNITLTNETGMPVKIGPKAQDCTVETDGEVVQNKGRNIEIKQTAGE